MLIIVTSGVFSSFLSIRSAIVSDTLPWTCFFLSFLYSFDFIGVTSDVCPERALFFLLVKPKKKNGGIFCFVLGGIFS